MSDESPNSLYCGLPATPANLPIWRELFWPAEWLELRASQLYQGTGIAKAEGDPVILVPGFLASDASLLEMHGWLERIGYDAYTSGFGRNDDCPDVLLKELIEKIEAVAAGKRLAVRLIGHSLGGVLARAAAIARPELVAQVITLGSPIRGVRIHPLVMGLSRILERSLTSPDDRPRPHGGHSHDGSCTCDLADITARPFPSHIPRTSIFSRSDGIVDCNTSLDSEPGQNIEVRATHVGLLFNVRAYRLIAELLASVTTAQPVEALVRA